MFSQEGGIHWFVLAVFFHPAKKNGRLFYSLIFIDPDQKKFPLFDQNGRAQTGKGEDENKMEGNGTQIEKLKPFRRSLSLII